MRFAVISRLPAWSRTLSLGLLGLLSSSTVASAAEPPRVTLVGSFQSELGCTTDGDAACTATDLTYESEDDVFQKSFSLPAGTHTYRVAIDGGAGGTYGAGAALDGPEISLTLAEPGSVKFYFDAKSRWATSRPSSTPKAVIATVAGSFQSEVGCPGDWSPSCLRSMMQDPDGDGVYVYTATIPEGAYAFKVAMDEGWATAYPGSDVAFSVPAGGSEVTFQFNADTRVPTFKVLSAPAGDINLARAHWVSRDTLLWSPLELPEAPQLKLHYDAAGTMVLGSTGIEGGESIPLEVDPTGPSAELKAKFPHLATFKALKIPAAELARVPELLQGQLALSLKNKDGKLVDATSVQMPGVLDALYTYDGPLGGSWSNGVPTLRLWAPTARSVRLHVFDSSDAATASHVADLSHDATTGVWSITGEADWKNKFYLYEVEVYVRSEKKVVKNLVTDPYSLSLAINSTRSQLVDLDDPALAPAGWNALKKPRLDAPEDIVLYELHVRDFSINDTTVPAEKRGTFAAFAEKASNGMKHLARLAGSGMTHVHLLPVFDIATINENRADQLVPAGDLVSLPADSQDQQAAVNAVRDQDGFNWGYDPYHYTVPEGSYAVNPDGSARILEFRQMVKGLSETGLRVVMDVVYNHTNSSGQDSRSVLDRIVPGYYHRLGRDSGNVETSTCCQNTASEHAMFEKLMVDSLVTWAKYYKVDGFRFDLMGHHMKANMVKVREALDALTLEKDGVDGSKIYLYGEGWNFGEVADGQRGVNATQLNMAGTGIGTFSDRLRDAVRGGGPFSGLREQGFASGLLHDPNTTDQGSTDDQRQKLLHYADQIRVGLAGNLRDYPLVNKAGTTVKGSQVDYNGQPAGYTVDPQEVITYVSAHDNETLFDAIQLKAAPTASIEERVRMHNLALDLVLLAQGIPFIHAGDEMLRSKSLDRNSYNSGDWFNKLDFTYASNNWGVGLPPAGDNSGNWSIMGPLLANPALKPSKEHIVSAVDHFNEMLRIRKSTTAFRQRTAADIQSKLRFHNEGPGQIPGLIVMELNDEEGEEGRTHVVVLFNASDEKQTFTLASSKDKAMQLHPVQQGSRDARLQEARFESAQGVFTVPARTTAVFVNAPSKGDTGCGCSGSSGGAFAALAMLLGGVLMSRRRRTRA
ncbi:MAG TPA: pullulanase-type alpha-1,6-glucosidase [Archangium sp.]|uniref:pullulanase-type alpha-1,6-glucosidase n=1 Tax=Archangium sp. TaxID=1872627 RepID=UPI002E2EB623|nr:pullulanase-type alpha-1,6-glucosidase [Archangium sp.]HEX5752777.1 pullulanase-type alpha-1,6-glucosidase [Archangium sp.]